MQRVLDISVPIRKGNRGGKDQFSWEDVKADKYKECYLGYSLNTARPTFNMPRPNAGWYAKKDQSGPVDIRAIKEEEDRAMDEALGLAPRRNHTVQKPLDKADLDNLTKRGATERGAFDDGERVEGVGFRPSYSHETVGGVITSVQTKLEGDEEAGWLEKGILATPARQDHRPPEHRHAADEWVERSVHDKPRSSSEKKEKKRKEKKEKKEKRHKKDKERRRDDSPERTVHRRSPSPAPRRRSPSPAPRRRSPSPAPRRRTPTPEAERSKPSERSHHSIRDSPRRRSRSPEPRDRDRDRERSSASSRRRNRSPEPHSRRR